MPWTLFVARALAAFAAGTLAAAGAGSASAGEPAGAKLPPWGPRDPAAYQLTVPGVDDVPDFKGDPENAQLVVFAAGNQFMVVPELVAAFERAHPGVKRVFVETLPPGILARQIAHGSIEVGDLVISARPDVFEAGKARMAKERAAGIVGRPTAYATNVLTIMVRRGNPKRIASLKDLGRPDVRVSMPNPQWEGIARQIIGSYRKAGGAALAAAIMQTKRAAGTTHLTQIHHRQTPIAILSGSADAGVTWISEALFQERLGNPIAHVVIPSSQNKTATYQAAVVASAPHPALAREWIAFLTTPAARAVYRRYGFGFPAGGHRGGR